MDRILNIIEFLLKSGTPMSIGAAVAALFKVGDHAPHGSPIVLPVVDHPLGFIISVLVGIAITVVMVNTLNKPVAVSEEAEAEDY